MVPLQHRLNEWAEIVTWLTELRKRLTKSAHFGWRSAMGHAVSHVRLEIGDYLMPVQTWQCAQYQRHT